MAEPKTPPVGTATRAFQLDDLYSLRVPSDPQLSPDGKLLAFTVTTPDQASDEDQHSIWLLDTSGGQPRRITHGPSAHTPRWDLDGKRLAFLCTTEEQGGKAQMFMLPIEGGEARRLTDLPLGAGEPVWAPDGKRIAFACPVDIDPPADDGAPMVINRLGHKADGLGRLRGLRNHLFVVDVETETIRQVTAGDFSASTPVWGPEGKALAFGAAMDEDADITFVSSVYRVGAEGGPPHRLTEHGNLVPAAWSSDGRQMLLTGRDQVGVGHTRLYTIDSEGGLPQPLTPGFDRNVMIGLPAYPGAMPRYVDGGRRVSFCARDRGRVHIMSVDSEGGEPEAATRGDRIVSGMSEANGSIAFAASDWDSPGEIYVIDRDGDERAVTDLFRAALPDVKLERGQEKSFTAPDGTTIEGWLLGGEGDRPGPLLVDIHGGPHNAWGPAFDGLHLYHQSLASMGWRILCINPRGSD
ncbi:MAG: serine hydrolase, partial [Actinobacteria bacterium]|nr:serine hydrolase [Actinomycetota bacterium]